MPGGEARPGIPPGEHAETAGRSIRLSRRHYFIDADEIARASNTLGKAGNG
jgi:hypothetical protein